MGTNTILRNLYPTRKIFALHHRPAMTSIWANYPRTVPWRHHHRNPTTTVSSTTIRTMLLPPTTSRYFPNQRTHRRHRIAAKPFHKTDYRKDLGQPVITNATSANHPITSSGIHATAPRQSVKEIASSAIEILVLKEA